MAEGPNSYGIEIKGTVEDLRPKASELVDLLEQGITKAELNERYGHVLGFRNINISMPAGAIQVIMGLSGSGKSTLIRHINRLFEPTVGQILVGGEDVVNMSPRELLEFRRHKTAMVFQKFALLPHRNVLENTVYGLEIQGLPRDGRSRRPCAGSSAWASKGSRPNIPTSFPAGCSSGSVSRAR